MKNSLLPLAFALLIGIGLGWMIKSDSSPSQNEPDRAEIPKRQSKRPPKEAAGAEAAKPKTKVTTRVIGGDDMSTPEMRDIQEKMANAMDASQRKKDDKRIAELVAKLGLTPAQKAKLEAHFQKKRSALASMLSGNETSAGVMNLSNESIDDVLADTLSADQQEAYDALKETEHKQKTEAKALRELAKITSAIDLRPEQKDAVYQALYDKADSAKQGPGNGLNAMISIMGDGFGMDVGSFDEIVIDDVGTNEDPTPENFREKMKANREKRINRQVAEMEPILDEPQLKEYREHLESKGSMLDSIVIPELGQ